MAVAERHGRAMGSRLHIVTVGAARTGSRRALEDAMQRAGQYVEHLERCWSRFLPTSDVSRINLLSPAGGIVEVDPATVTLLASMVDGYERTAGRFDPTMLRAVIAEGYAHSRVDPTLVSEVGPPAPNPAWLHDLRLDATANTVTVPPGLVLDPGGIGKGLAADLTVGRLLDEGVDGAMVEIGGDLATGGIPVHSAGWIVDVEHPDPEDGRLCSLAISGGGVATSSVRSCRWTRDGVERHHQIDADTATCSTTDLTTVTVIAPAAWLAEVHATAALAVGSEQAMRYLDGHGLSGLAVASTVAGERVWTTSDLHDVDVEVGCSVP